MAIRAIGWVALTATAVAGAYWYYSPEVTFYRLQRAVEASDVQAFEAHVDYLRVRDSIRQQVATILESKLGGSPAADLSLGGLLASSMMSAFAERAVIELARPQVLMRALAEGELDDRPNAKAASPEQAYAPRWHLDWRGEHIGMNKYLVRFRSDIDDIVRSSARATLVFEREGFAHWSLVEVRLPPPK